MFVGQKYPLNKEEQNGDICQSFPNLSTSSHLSHLNVHGWPIHAHLEPIGVRQGYVLESVLRCSQECQQVSISILARDRVVSKYDRTRLETW